MKQYAQSGSPYEMECPTLLLEQRGYRPAGVALGYPLRLTFKAEKSREQRAADPKDKDACCYTWTLMCPGGRPWLDGEQAVVAPLRDGDAWLRRRVAVDEELTATQRERLAQAWLADARSEHASIAAFARTTLELLSVGAPAELLRESQRAGLDEVRHAERCFELAAAYGGVALQPGPLPLLAPREASLERLAVDTFLEGCVGETVSALHALRASTTPDDRAPAAVAATWKVLASDELRHAALAWKTLAWILRQPGAVAAPRLAELSAELYAAVLAAGHDAEPDPEALPGRLSPRALAAVHHDAWREIILPTLRQLLAAA